MSTRQLAYVCVLLAAAACSAPTGGEPAKPSGGEPVKPVAANAPGAEGAKPVLQQAAGPVEAARKLKTTTGGAVTMEVVPQYETVFTGDRELNVLLRLKGTGDAPKKRPPLDLALVIDRSGSMSGDKLRAVKEASLKLLDRLGPEDRVTLTSYSSDVSTHTTRLSVDDRGKEVLRGHVLGIRSTGMTALGPALIRAVENLGAGGRDDVRTAHVMMLSDGIANVGETKPEVLGRRSALAFNQGITVSTLGVGLDYNEDLMTRLADQGGGRYHFIKDAAATAQVLDDEMNGLVATVARGVEVRVAGATAGVEVVKAFGYPTTKDDGATRVRIGTLGAKQTREVMLRLRLPESAAGTLDVSQFVVRYTDVAADGVERTIDSKLAVKVSADQKVSRGTERAEVTVRVAEVESAAQMEMAARAADRGDFGAANSSLQMAIQDLEQKSRRLPSPKLKKQIADLKEAQGEVKQARSSASARKAYTKKFKAKAYKARKR